jgi:hypothetical protein
MVALLDSRQTSSGLHRREVEGSRRRNNSLPGDGNTHKSSGDNDSSRALRDVAFVLLYSDFCAAPARVSHYEDQLDRKPVSGSGRVNPGASRRRGAAVSPAAGSRSWCTRCSPGYRRPRALQYTEYMSETRAVAGAPRRARKATRPPRSRQTTFARRSFRGASESAVSRGRPGARPMPRTS